MAASASSSAGATPAVAAQTARIHDLIAKNLYDTKIVPELEENVRFQIKNNSYDPDSNRELLKLYAVAPDMASEPILARLLLKCLMEMAVSQRLFSLHSTLIS